VIIRACRCRGLISTFGSSGTITAGSARAEHDDDPLRLVDSLQPDEIPVFACTNPARIAPWGELLSTAARARGAAGALMDGCTRDVRAIRAMGFPVFHGGIAPLDSKGRGRIMALDVPVDCGVFASRLAIWWWAMPTASS
jgi:regulator of RNase E activity RraA